MLCIRLIRCFSALLICLPFLLSGQSVTIVRANVDIDFDGNITKYKYGAGEGDPLNGAFVADITAASELKMISLNVLTTEAGGCQATAARIYYRIYPQGGSAPAYQSVEFTDLCSCAGDPDCWPTPQSDGCASAPSGRSFQDLSVEIDLKAAAIANGGGIGTYVLEAYWEADGSSCATVATPVATASYTSNVVLPVELISFNAHRTGSAVRLQWATASELNSDHFEVERSGDLSHWETIGTLASRGSHAAMWQAYNLRDEKPLADLNYYRLRQVDKDGSQHYSPIAVVRMNQGSTAQIAPNPAGDGLTWLTLRDFEGTANLRLFDTYGRLLRQWKPEVQAGQRIAVDIAAFANGFLWLQVNEQTPIKIVKH